MITKCDIPMNDKLCFSHIAGPIPKLYSHPSLNRFQPKSSLTSDGLSSRKIFN